VGVVGVPIAFVGSGERLQDLEPFHPDRVVSRVLGMGDVLTLIEKAEQAVSEEDAQKLERKLRLDEFTLEDFRDQLRTIRKMGPLEHILGLIPGMGNLKELSKQREEIDDRQILRIEAIINSMTGEERRRHDIINGSRRKRIARGSGTSVEEVNRLLKQFVQMKKMLREWERQQPGRLDNIFTAMGNVVPSHLMDRKLYPFTTLQTTGVVNPEGDRAFDEDEDCASPVASPIRIHRDD